MKETKQVPMLARYDTFTVRTIDTGPLIVELDAFQAVCAAAETAMKALKLSGHLFISVVGSDVITSEGAEDECGFAVYIQQLQNVVICAGEVPEEMDGDRDHWLKELKVSTVHEIVHYWQELTGDLESLPPDELEEIAETKSREIVDAAR